MRPDLSVNVAFLEHCPPTGPQVVSTLANRGIKEIVLVPLSITSVALSETTEVMVKRISAAHPQLRISAARPIGPSVELLPMLNIQMRAALRSRQTSQLDALVLAAPDAGDARGVSLLRRRARQWAAEHRLTCQLALNDGSGPSTAQVVSGLRAQGRRHIAVGSLWLAPDRAWATQARAAIDAGATAVSDPLGVHDRLLELALGRYAYAAMSLVRDEMILNTAIAL